jgi:hypothetical protein
MELILWFIGQFTNSLGASLKSMRKGGFFIMIMFLIGCGKGNQDLFDLYNITFNFINDTQEKILIFGDCGFDLQPIDTELIIDSGTTVKVFQTKREIMISERLDTNNFDLFIGSCFAIYGDSLKCDFGAFNGIRGIENYEERIAHSPTDFEFTYRFTEKTMDEAGSCN